MFQLTFSRRVTSHGFGTAPLIGAAPFPGTAPLTKNFLQPF